MSVDRSPVFSAKALHLAWRDCRRRKRSTPGAMAFEMHLFDEMKTLEEALENRTFRPRPCIRFATARPKLREIVAADFRDRVVHHLYVRAVEPHFERVFIHDSFACRKGKGTHAAVDRLTDFVRSATRGGQDTAFFLKLDIRSFFMSIDRRVLLERLERGLNIVFGLRPGPDPVCFPKRAMAQRALPLPSVTGRSMDLKAYEDLLWLTRLLVMHNPLEGCIDRGNKSLLAKVPPHKTLAGCAPWIGLPIGNLTSQFFANVYLDALDQYVKHVLKVKRYVRYVDDLVLVHERREALEQWRALIEEYLGQVLKLSLNHARTSIKQVSCGIDFLGYVVHPEHRLVRRRVVGNLRERLEAAQNRLVREDGDKTVLRYPCSEVARLESVLGSYTAHFRKADAVRLTRSIWRKFPFLGAFVGRSGEALVPRDKPRRFRGGFRQQYRWFAKRAFGGVLFFQVGRYFELFDDQAETFGRLLGLKPISNRPGCRSKDRGKTKSPRPVRRGACSPRRDHEEPAAAIREDAGSLDGKGPRSEKGRWCFSRPRCGFHRRYLSRFVEKALEKRLPVTVVRETVRRTGGLKERRIVFRIIPRDPPRISDDELLEHREGVVR